MIGIIDYGAGNTQSVRNALKKLDIPHFLSYKKNELDRADSLILPGVGHANSAMEALKQNDLVEYILQESRPLLGICLGMQLLCDYSEEGNTPCLGLYHQPVIQFDTSKVKVPSMGWNEVSHLDNPLFKGIDQKSYFYFVHSYYVPAHENMIASANYETIYAVAIQKDNFYGVQFHPEKSAKAGLKLLQNFNQVSTQK